jgi:hypothetical protein
MPDEPIYEKDAEAADQIAVDNKRELDACDEILAEILERANPWQGRSINATGNLRPTADEIIAMEFSRTLTSYRASIKLARTGYAEQAAMLNRSLFEGMLVAHWVHINEDLAVANFRRAGLLNDYLWVERLGNTGWFEDGDVPVEAIEVDEEELQAMKADFGRYGEKLWTGHNSIRELLPEVEDLWQNEIAKRELHNYLRIANTDNNQILHSTVSGLSRLISRQEDDGLRLWLGASNRHVPQALYGAYWNFANLVTLIFDRFELPNRDAFDKAFERRQFDFHRFTKADVKDVKRNDPCPCGRGKKFKKCHLDQIQGR